MIRIKVAAGVLACALATAVAATAQQPSPPADGRGRDGRAGEIERDALGLLEEAVATAQGLKLAENRARVHAAAAGLLWPRDEKSARALFEQAAESVRALLNELDPTDPRYQERWQSLWQLRSEVLQAVAQHDPKLALGFLRATRQPPSQANYAGRRPPDQELALEADLAARVAAQDPKEAARIIEDGLRRGVSPNLLHALQQLSQKDPDAASRLAAAAIARINVEDLLRSYEVAGAAAQLISMTVAPAPPSAGSGGGTTEPSRAGGVNAGLVAVDAASRRAVFETLVAAALSGTADRAGPFQNILGVLQSSAAEVERYVPGRAAAVRRRIAEFERTQDPRSRAWREYQQVLQQGDTEALLEAAAAAPPEIRDDLYTNAAWRVSGQDLDRARQVAEKISNPQQRAQLVAEFEGQRPWRAAEKGEFDLARQLVAGLPTPERRASTLVAMARAALGRDQKKAAREFLEEARRQFDWRARNGGEFNAQLDIANAYAAIDPAQSFDIIEASVDRLNELIAAAAAVDGFIYTDFREGEMSPQGGGVWAEFIGRCAAGLAALAARDFDRASAAVRRFERADARVAAELHLARAILTDGPQERQGPGIGRSVTAGSGFGRGR